MSNEKIYNMAFDKVYPMLIRYRFIGDLLQDEEIGKKEHTA